LQVIKKYQSIFPFQTKEKRQISWKNLDELIEKYFFYEKKKFKKIFFEKNISVFFFKFSFERKIL